VEAHRAAADDTKSEVAALRCADFLSRVFPAVSLASIKKGIAAPASFQVKKLMADKANKLPENAEGAWYVDNTCTPCRVCLDEAPTLLKYNDDETYVYFHKQPENDEETGAAQRAMDVCPTLAIGNDGP
jgi:ferredoxin